MKHKKISLALAPVHEAMYIFDMMNNEDFPFTDRKRTRPNLVHPTVPGAVGSHESPYRDGRETVSEAKLIITDTIRNVMGDFADEHRRKD